MSLFEEQADESVRRPGRGRRAGWILLAIAMVILVVLGVAPAPYVIDRPGPVFNTLGTATHDGEEVPLISVPTEETFPTAGALDLLTVSQVGTPSNRPSWAEVAMAWLDPSQAVVPIEAAFPPDVSSDELQQQNQALMVDSQRDAIAAALVQLGYDFPRDVTVSGVAEGSPADGVLEDGDIITSVNGVEVQDISALRKQVKENGADEPADVGIDRDGTQSVVQITPTESGNAVVLGIGVGMDYEFPFEVKIQLDNVGGPSAGQMFALGIIDTLTPGYLNGGEDVAGTGTIDSSGTIGPIGGIRQKLYGAKDSGADWFLAPASNCDEVVGHVPGGLRVFAVKTLDDSMAALEAIASGDGLDDLPTCDAS